LEDGIFPQLHHQSGHLQIIESSNFGLILSEKIGLRC
jgi:hypothetical protein